MTQAAEPREHKAVLVLPTNLGLSDTELDSLRESFQNSVVERLGGREAIAARPVVIIIIIEYAAPEA